MKDLENYTVSLSCDDIAGIAIHCNGEKHNGLRIRGKWSLSESSIHIYLEDEIMLYATTRYNKPEEFYGDKAILANELLKMLKISKKQLNDWNDRQEDKKKRLLKSWINERIVPELNYKDTSGVDWGKTIEFRG